LPGPPLADASFFFPLDFPSVQRRAFDAVAPALLLLIETELWPNVLAEAQARGVPVVVANARLAPERLARYERLAGLYRPMLRTLAGVGAADAAEGERFVALGVPRSALRITGNIKFEIEGPVEGSLALRARYGLLPARPVVAAGSTGAGEDALVLDAYVAAKRRRPDLALVLAPRHPSRFDAAAESAIARRLRVAYVSRGETLAEADVLVVDTIGQLAALYGLASAAFVGGSLVPVGGHNLLEPVAAGVPVLFGPHTGHVAETAEALLRSGAGERVSDAAALARAWDALIDDAKDKARRAEAGRALLAMHRGALARTVDLVRDVLAEASAR
jgi:3-deoxy-D-manno-octulosonic-acid transferase